jgi:bacterioferritin
MNEEYTDSTRPDCPSLYKCAHPAPYPKIRVTRPNFQYAQLLLEDYAGKAGEFTATAQYIYHHFVLENINEEVAELLKCVAIVEMHHMEILAETIQLLGVDPKFRIIERNQTEKYWDASYVFYGTALCDRLMANISGEWAAIANYRKHQSMIDDIYVKQILERIIMDEKYHIDLFNRAAKKYCKVDLLEN